MKIFDRSPVHDLPPRGVGRFGRQKFKDWIAFSDDPDILIAQYANLKRQVPLLYILLIIIALAGRYLHSGSELSGVITGASVVFIVVASIRLAKWVWFFPPPENIGIEEVRAVLHRTTFAVVPICLAYLAFAFVLDRYGDPAQQAAVAVCLVLTSIGCIFCLIHLPQAALLVNAITMLPYAGYHLYRGNDTFLLIALVAGVVTTLMIRVSRNAFEGFTELITSRAELAVQRSEAERLAAENASLAMTDALTGLPNRRLFLARLEKQVAHSASTGEPFVVGVLDLDRFKAVNDVYGHAKGDQLLVEVGKRLQSVYNEALLFARLGGDEFGLLVDGSTALAQSVGEEIIALFARPFEFDGQGFSVGCSIGFADFPDAGRSASDLFDRADYALYQVKVDRRGGFSFFTNDLDSRLRAETELEATLLSANLEQELAVEMQPILCLRSARVIGIEALGRWENALLGKVEPARFIEAAERLKIISRITTILFEKALASAAMLQDDFALSFNLSTHDIVTATTIDLLIAAIERHGICAKRITFEITETALMRDFDAAIENIERLRLLGVSIALDDFGTGFSSLNYLSRLPIDKIKIDRSFVRNLAEPGVKKIVTAILAMCDTLELECIVEGVETVEECRSLMSLGCDMAQGFLFARPMAIPALQSWLDQHRDQSLGDAFLPGLKNHPAFIQLHQCYAPALKSG
ncbi:MAG: EAL domain-containing protein [Novosphingobium sp.]|nr:EAL domain-containing protein [Novosphingobium sp.]